MDIRTLVRKNILSLKPYSSARNEFKGEASVYLDANENPNNNPYNRYPDPLQWKLKEKIAQIKGVKSTQIMLGNGSDEPIDLIIRIFCEPAQDNIVSIDPTYGMYEVCADINNVEYRKVLLNNDFELNAEELLKAIDEKTKVIFLCSPNNPTGNLLKKEEILKILDAFKGIIVIDEAYIDFSSQNSWLPSLNKYPNLIILQTFSKAWGIASVRCGMAFASELIINYFNQVKYPYNINVLTQNFVDEHLENKDKKEKWVQELLEERASLIKNLQELPQIKKVYPTDANFVLIKVADANKVYQSLVEKGIIVRNRDKVSLCQGCLRITVGTKEENKLLIKELKNILN